MHRNQGNQAGSQRAERLAYRGVGLIDTQRLALICFLGIISDDGVEHWISQAVEQAVNTQAYSKRDKNRSKAG